MFNGGFSLVPPDFTSSFGSCTFKFVSVTLLPQLIIHLRIPPSKLLGVCVWLLVCTTASLMILQFLCLVLDYLLHHHFWLKILNLLCTSFSSPSPGMDPLFA